MAKLTTIHCDSRVAAASAGLVVVFAVVVVVVAVLVAIAGDAVVVVVPTAGERNGRGRTGWGEARMLSMSPFESSDVLSVAFSQNFDFYRLNVVAVVGVAVAIAIVKFDAAAALLLLLTICYFLFAICYLLLAMIDDANRSHWGYRVGSRLCPSVCRSAPLPYHHPSPFTPTHTVRRVSMSVCLLCAIMIGIISGMPWKMKTANWQRQHFPSRCFPFAATTSSSASAASTSTAACCNSKLPVATELAAMQ